MSGSANIKRLYRLNHLERIEDVGSEKSHQVQNPFVNQSDQSVWTAFKQGDQSAYVFIYETFFADLINYGHQFSRNEQLVEDCVQDLFIDLKRRRKNLTTKNSSIKFYLYKSLKRRIIEYRRKDEKIVVDKMDNDMDFEIVLPVETLLVEKQIKEEKIAQLSKAVDQLTARQREVIYYLFHVGLSYDEIREIMGFEHVRSVRNVFYKALSSLKDHFHLFIFLSVSC